MADKYKMKANFELTKEDGTLMWVGDNTWHNLEYEDVVKLEAVIVGGLGQLGMDELEEKKKKKP